MATERIATDRIAADLIDNLFDSTTGTRLLREALRLLADGEPITVAKLAAAAGVPEPDLAGGPGGADIEYDPQGRITGWGLTHNPTPHRFTVNGHELYTWCAPDTLIFPAVIGTTARVESPCAKTGVPIRLTVDPALGVTAVEPATAVVSIVNPEEVNRQQVRASLCDPQRFFATAEDARDWQSRYPGMTVLPVADAYHTIALPIAQATINA